MRQTRNSSNLNHIYIHNWNTFRQVWRNTEFSKQFSTLSSEQITTFMLQKLNDLKIDEKHLCYLFPCSLKMQHVELIIKLVQAGFSSDLDFEYQALYYGQDKQLLVYRCDFRSLTSYLSKYRLPNKYKQVFTAVNKPYQQFQNCTIKRNLAISHRQPIQQIQKIGKQIQVINKKKLTPILGKYRKFMEQIFKDFQRQQKKVQIMIEKANSLIRKQLQQICEGYPNEIKIMDRYYSDQTNMDVKDIIIFKDNQNSDEQGFSLIDSDNQLLQEQQNDTGIKQIKLVIPKSLNTVTVDKFMKQGIKCKVELKKYGKANRPTNIRVKLQNKKCCEFHKKYQKIYAISEDNTNEDDFIIQQIILEIVTHGYTQYLVTATNQVGDSRPTIVKVWVQSPPNFKYCSQQIDNIQLRNLDKRVVPDSLFVLGNNSEGVIFNNDKDQNSIITTTNNKWIQSGIGCTDFSVSNHTIICSSIGDVAGWGKMYCFGEQQQQQKKQQNQQGNMFQFMKPYSFRIQRTSLILDQKFIRKVSCGESYCLMTNNLGEVWSFGVNNFGQLGLGHSDSMVDTSEPKNVLSLKDKFIVDVVATNYGSAYAIDAQGVSYRWGLNQLQASTKPILDSYKNIINFEYEDIIISQHTPIPLNKRIMSDPVKQIGGGKDFSLILTKDNVLYGWGNTRYLGIKDLQNSHFENIKNICNPIPIMKNVLKFAIGASHILALTENKQLLAWGNSAYYSQNNKFQSTPEVILQQFKGQFFDCEINYTVIQIQESIVKVFGQNQLAKVKEGFKLPCKANKIKLGDGVIMVKGTV